MVVAEVRLVIIVRSIRASPATVLILEGEMSVVVALVLGGSLGTSGQ